MLVFVLGTTTMVNANTGIVKGATLNFEFSPPGWTCEEWSNFCFDWAQLCGASFQDAAAVADAEFHNCLKQE